MKSEQKVRLQKTSMRRTSQLLHAMVRMSAPTDQCRRRFCLHGWQPWTLTLSAETTFVICVSAHLAGAPKLEVTPSLGDLVGHRMAARRNVLGQGWYVQHTNPWWHSLASNLSTFWWIDRSESIHILVDRSIAIDDRRSPENLEVER